MQFSSLIYIDQAEVALSNVNFYNIVVKRSVILSQSQLDVYSTSFKYSGGGIELLNNGYELNNILGSSSFLRLTNFLKVYIEDLDIKNNIGMEENHLFDLNNIYEIRFWRCNLTYNIFESHIINIDQKKISSFASIDHTGYEYIVHIYSHIFGNNYAEHIINFMYDLNSQTVLIEKVEFLKNSAVVALYYTSNFQDISKPVKDFNYFIIYNTSFELNYIDSLIKVFSVPLLFMEQMKAEKNGLAFDVKTEILNAIMSEGGVYLKNSKNFKAREVDYLVYLSISIYSALQYSEFYYNAGPLFNIKQSYLVYFIYTIFENNYIDEDAFIEADDFVYLTIDQVLCQNNTALKKEAYFMNFNGANADNIVSIGNVSFVDSNIGIYIAFSGEILFENISIVDSYASSLPLLNVKIEKPSSFILKNSVFNNNMNDILNINSEFGQVSLNFLIENTNFTNCKAASNLIYIGSELLLSNNTQNLIKNCEFSNNIGNVFAIESSDGEIYFENCSFVGNSASDSGVVLGFTTTTIYFINTEFSQNREILLNFNLNANSIKTFECIFYSNFGIVVQSIISNYFDYKSLFTGNQAIILKIQSEGSATLNSSVIISNTISSENSLLEILSGSELVISNVTIYNNTSTQKAILMIENDSGANISDSVFESNSAYRGSALLIQHCTSNSVNLINVQFLNNNAELSGTIFVLEGYLTVENCEFFNNKAIYSAGIDAIYSSLVYISNTKFNSQAGKGSCIKSQDSSLVSVKNSEFKGFYSSLYGTLIEVKESELTFDNCEFENVEFDEGYLILGENS